MVRTCVGCRRRADQEELSRVVALSDGSLAFGRRLPGRGAWLCRDSARCVELASRREGIALARALRTNLATDALATLLGRI